ncbi:hypothetical protein TYRP_013203 [Tyrophagus putrescentiae]|nr:hypothetical protein TYRP_013203 [Tyrophagus putrescentiae]
MAITTVLVVVVVMVVMVISTGGAVRVRRRPTNGASVGLGGVPLLELVPLTIDDELWLPPPVVLEAALVPPPPPLTEEDEGGSTTMPAEAKTPLQIFRYTCSMTFRIWSMSMALKCSFRVFFSSRQGWGKM